MHLLDVCSIFDFDFIIAYVRFWIDVIHCYWSREKKEDLLDPPIIVVCTNTDRYKVNMKTTSEHITNVSRNIREIKTISCRDARQFDKNT